MKTYNHKFIPKLREDIEFIPTSFQGKRGLIARDSLGLIQKPVLLQGEILEFLSLIDGERNIRDFQIELMRWRGGVFVSSEEVEKLLFELDSAFLLDNERYQQEKERIITEYSLLDVRKAFHAGRSYPGEQGELNSYLDSFFHLEKEPSFQLEDKKIVAMISPHIDLEAGKKIYSEAYTAIRNSIPQRIFLFGTGHSLHESFLSLTEKDFETPLGRIKTDKDCVRRLIETGKEVVSPNDVAHRSEHSLEFQLIFLQRLFGSDFFLIPVLFGSFQKILEKFSRPSEIPGVDNFLEALKLSLGESEKETLIIAGVDFSHVGPKFGHGEQATSMLLETKNHDKRLIDAICKGDVEGFWAESRNVRDKYNVCGFSTMACLLEILGGTRGYLLDYDIWHEEPTQSAVSFAAIAFESK